MVAGPTNVRPPGDPADDSGQSESATKLSADNDDPKPPEEAASVPGIPPEAAAPELPLLPNTPEQTQDVGSHRTNHGSHGHHHHHQHGQQQHGNHHAHHHHGQHKMHHSRSKEHDLAMMSAKTTDARDEVTELIAGHHQVEDGWSPLRESRGHSMTFGEVLSLLREVHQNEVHTATLHLREENVHLRTQLGSQVQVAPGHTSTRASAPVVPIHHAGHERGNGKTVTYSKHTKDSTAESHQRSGSRAYLRQETGDSLFNQPAHTRRQITTMTSRTDTEWLSHSQSGDSDDDDDEDEEDEENEKGRQHQRQSQKHMAKESSVPLIMADRPSFLDTGKPSLREMAAHEHDAFPSGPPPTPAVGITPLAAAPHLDASVLVVAHSPLGESWNMSQSAASRNEEDHHSRLSGESGGAHSDGILRLSVGEGTDLIGGNNLPLRRVWRLERVGSSVSQSGALGEVNFAEDVEDTETIRTQRGHGRVARLVSHPNSSRRVVWDVIGGIMILYDCVIIPLRVFDPPDTAFLILMDWLTLVFWTLNMAASCLVGYVEKGVYIMVPRKIVLQYLRTWFIVDMIVVSQDWVFVVLSAASDNDSDASGTVRLVRTLRIIRTLRLVRLMKLRRILVLLNEFIDSEHVSILANIVKMIIMLLAINHLIACAWFALAKSRDSDSTTWVKSHGLWESRWDFQYMTSFHWSITQFTPASMDVGPTNLQERVFAVSVVVFALVGFSYLVGSITGSLTQLRSMQEDTAKQFWNLRRFLKQHEVPPKLSLRVQKHLEHAWSQKRERLPMNQILLFQLLSEQLRSELLAATSVPPMRIHPLFRHYENTRGLKVTIQRLANGAISRKALAIGDKLFYPGEKARDMYFPATGKLQYWKEGAAGSFVHNEIVDMDEDWIAEPVLWTAAWYHLGVLIALYPSDMLLVSAREFANVVKQNPQALMVTRRYARRFMDWFMQQEPRSDIIQGDDHADLIETFLQTDPTTPLNAPAPSGMSTALSTKKIRGRVSLRLPGIATGVHK